MLRALLLFHPEMKALLTPFQTAANKSLSLPLVSQLADLGLHLSCLQVEYASHFCCIDIAQGILAFKTFELCWSPPHLLFNLITNITILFFEPVKKEGKDQRKLLPWSQLNIKVIDILYTKFFPCSPIYNHGPTSKSKSSQIPRSKMKCQKPPCW